ncbi:hypothetical protein GLW36_03265 [Halorubrum terrestre]|uniref:Fibronectin type-III domain-containing protein n=1 Tax=Halorubrum distributum TaxID=29283 RepID=A0A6B1I9D3_9EURY|nr:fibronectin type III domain-containing protein [Halorubrum terrestre]MYL15669.1 hypothetical protein [Halorubrum terrestre]
MAIIQITGDQDWTVPQYVSAATFRVYGEDGEDGISAGGGTGGYSTGNRDVSPGETYLVRTSPGGVNDYEGGSGGDGAWVAIGSEAVEDRIIAAGGGGGGAGGSDGDFTYGGDGGGLQGTAGDDGGFNAGGGGPGTQTGGGDGVGTETSYDGDASGGGEKPNQFGRAGAGGGGYYGGGAGGEDVEEPGAGGGGSGHIGGVTNATTEQGSFGGSRNFGNGSLVEIEYDEPPEPVSNFNAFESNGVITLTWDGAANDGRFRVRRGPDGSVSNSDTLVASVSSGGSHTVTDAPGYGTFYYRVERWSPDVGTIDYGPVSQEFFFELPAPTNLTIGAVDDASFDLSWTDNSDGDATYRADVAEDDDGNWQPKATFPAGAESGTVDGLLNGQRYGVRIVAEASGQEAVDK